MTDTSTPGPEIRKALVRLEELGYHFSRVEAIAGDLSQRSHWRLHSGTDTSVLTVYPHSLHSQCERFRRSSALLDRVGVPTPEILRSRCSEGWMLLEDAGPSTWFERFRTTEPERLRELYERALDYLERIRTLPESEIDDLNPRLDSRALRRELARSWTTVLVPERLVEEGSSGAIRLSNAFDTLCHTLENSGLAPAHRDFMVRNLVPVRDQRKLVVLDHQDLRLAPPAYDLASLLNDSLFPSPGLEDRLLDLVPVVDLADYRRAVVQRCVKAVGNYREGSRRGRPVREDLIVPTLRRAWRQMAHLSEFSRVVPALRSRWERFLATDGAG
ncbi:MAG: phosphotransferase [Thermoanaerobaculia bacterium]|nr:phosphotransferase [Thermoanaerobaculia bacterium]